MNKQVNLKNSFTQPPNKIGKQIQSNSQPPVKNRTIDNSKQNRYNKIVSVNSPTGENARYQVKDFNQSSINKKRDSVQSSQPQESQLQILESQKSSAANPSSSLQIGAKESIEAGKNSQQSSKNMKYFKEIDIVGQQIQDMSDAEDDQISLNTQQKTAIKEEEMEYKIEMLFIYFKTTNNFKGNDTNAHLITFSEFSQFIDKFMAPQFKIVMSQDKIEEVFKIGCKKDDEYFDENMSYAQFKKALNAMVTYIYEELIKSMSTDYNDIQKKVISLSNMRNQASLRNKQPEMLARADQIVQKIQLMERLMADENEMHKYIQNQHLKLDQCWLKLIDQYQLDLPRILTLLETTEEELKLAQEKEAEEEEKERLKKEKKEEETKEVVKRPLSANKKTVALVTVQIVQNFESIPYMDEDDLLRPPNVNAYEQLNQQLHRNSFPATQEDESINRLHSEIQAIDTFPQSSKTELDMVDKIDKELLGSPRASDQYKSTNEIIQSSLSQPLLFQQAQKLDIQEDSLSDNNVKPEIIQPEKWVPIGDQNENQIGEDGSIKLKIVQYSLESHLEQNSDNSADEASLRFVQLFSELKQIDADVIGISEIHSFQGNSLELFQQLVKGMNEMDYSYQHFDRDDQASASVVFFKRDKILLGASRQNPFTPGESEFLMLCFFIFKENQDFRFIFGQTCLKQGKQYRQKRIIQSKMIKQYLGDICMSNPDLFLDIPILIGGNFNEIPERESIKLIMNSSFQDLYSIMSNQKGERDVQHPLYTMVQKMKGKEVKKSTTSYIFMARNDYQKNNSMIFQKFLDPSNESFDDKLQNSTSNFTHLCIGYEVRMNLPQQLIQDIQIKKEIEQKLLAQHLFNENEIILPIVNEIVDNMIANIQEVEIVEEVIPALKKRRSSSKSGTQLRQISAKTRSIVQRPVSGVQLKENINMKQQSFQKQKNSKQEQQIESQKNLLGKQSQGQMKTPQTSESKKQGFIRQTSANKSKVQKQNIQAVEAQLAESYKVQKPKVSKNLQTDPSPARKQKKTISQTENTPIKKNIDLQVKQPMITQGNLDSLDHIEDSVVSVTQQINQIDQVNFNKSAKESTISSKKKQITSPNQVQNDQRKNQIRENQLNLQNQSKTNYKPLSPPKVVGMNQNNQNQIRSLKQVKYLHINNDSTNNDPYENNKAHNLAVESKQRTKSAHVSESSSINRSLKKTISKKAITQSDLVDSNQNSPGDYQDAIKLELTKQQQLKQNGGKFVMQERSVRMVKSVQSLNSRGSPNQNKKKQIDKTPIVSKIINIKNVQNNTLQEMVEVYSTMNNPNDQSKTENDEVHKSEILEANDELQQLYAQQNYLREMQTNTIQYIPQPEANINSENQVVMVPKKLKQMKKERQKYFKQQNPMDQLAFKMSQRKEVAKKANFKKHVMGQMQQNNEISQDVMRAMQIQNEIKQRELNAKILKKQIQLNIAMNDVQKQKKQMQRQMQQQKQLTDQHKMLQPYSNNQYSSYLSINQKTWQFSGNANMSLVTQNSKRFVSNQLHKSPSQISVAKSVFSMAGLKLRQRLKTPILERHSINQSSRGSRQFRIRDDIIDIYQSKPYIVGGMSVTKSTDSLFKQQNMTKAPQGADGSTTEIRRPLSASYKHQTQFQKSKKLKKAQRPMSAAVNINKFQNVCLKQISDQGNYN